MRRILWVGLGIGVAGCGGGGGGTPVHPATTFRANGAGDSWAYSVTANFSTLGNATGTLSYDFTADTFDGKPSLRDTRNFQLYFGSVYQPVVDYNEYSTTGQLLAVYGNDALLGVTADTYSLGPTIGPTTQAQGTITLSDGETLNEDFYVTGTDEVTTPAGQFACWTAVQKVVHSNGDFDVYQLWMAPELGNWVKAIDTTTEPGGFNYTWTATLTTSSVLTAPAAKRSTSFALPPLPIGEFASAPK